MLIANLIFKESVKDEGFNSSIIFECIEEAVANNIKNLVIAPAYYDKNSKSSIEKVKEIVDELNGYLKVKDIDINLYAGNLLRDNYENIKEYVNGNLGSINESDYILLDIEECDKIDDILEIVFEYRLRNLIPIIVSPEKINEIIKNNKNIDKLKEEGCLFQLDPASLKEVYGKAVKKTAKALLKRNIYKFIGFEEKIDSKLINRNISDISKEGIFIVTSEKVRRNNFKKNKRKRFNIFN